MTVTDPNATLTSTCTPANGSPLAPGDVDHLHGQPHDHPGRHRRRQLLQPGLCRRRCRWRGRGVRRRRPRRAAEPAPDDHQGRDRDELQRGRRRHPLHDHGDQRRQHDAGGVTVTDPNATTSTARRPTARRWPRAQSITCTASHTITQADIDAGSYFNQACVDDGAGGAAEACDDVTTPGGQNPHLTITKVATETSYSAVGDVIHYTITATNDGNTTLRGGDGHRSERERPRSARRPTARRWPRATRSPARPATRSRRPTSTPAATSTRPVSTTEPVVRRGVRRRHHDGLEEPAPGHRPSVDDDGDHRCGSVGPVRDVVTNTGNTTLSRRARLTDDELATASVTCTPAQPATLAPSATMTCSASHTITQADLEARATWSTSRPRDVGPGVPTRHGRRSPPGPP